MVRILTLSALMFACGALALADSWNGKLIDATCYEQQKGAAPCDATANTTAFAVIVSNQMFTLDAAGNTKAAEALRNRADRSAEPAKPQSSQVMAKVTGTKEGNVLKVESIELQ